MEWSRTVANLDTIEPLLGAGTTVEQRNPLRQPCKADTIFDLSAIEM